MWTAIALAWLFCVAAGALVGHSRSNTIEGTLYPFFLGPIGLLMAIAWVRPPSERTTTDQAAGSRSSLS